MSIVHGQATAQGLADLVPMPLEEVVPHPGARHGPAQLHDGGWVGLGGLARGVGLEVAGFGA